MAATAMLLGLLLLALVMILQEYGSYRRYDAADGEVIGRQWSIGVRYPQPSHYYATLTWERYPTWRPTRIEIRRDAANKWLRYQPALILRWQGFRLVLLGRLAPG